MIARTILSIALFVFAAAAQAQPQEGETCGAEALRPIYYAPTSPSDALAAGRGEPPPQKARVSLAFRLEGRPPCRENACRLLVLGEDGRKIIASVNLDRRDVKFCRLVEVQDADKGASPPCAAPALNVSSRIEFKGDDRDGALERVTILIDHQYYLFKAGERSLADRLFNAQQKAAAACRALGAEENPQARVGAWKITSKTGAVTIIHETDALKSAGDYRDFDLAKLFVSAPNPDPPPRKKDTDPTGARTIR